MKRALFAVVFFPVFSAVIAVGAFASPRGAMLQLDYDRVIREFEGTQQPSTEARAFHVYALHRLGATTRATTLANELREQHPDDPWAWYAMLAVTRGGDDKEGAGQTMLRLAGETPDEEMVRLQSNALSMRGEEKEALALIDEQPRTPRMILARANVLRGRRDTPAEVAELADEVLAMLPDHVEALAMRADYDLGKGNAADAVKRYQRAASLSPAIGVHQGLWRALRKDKSLAPERMRELLEADMKLLAERRAETPAVLLAMADHYEELGETEKGREYGDRILRDAPASLQAPRVLLSRMYEEEETPEARARMRRIAETILTWPHPIDETLKAQAHQSLFLAKRDDPKVTGEELLRHAEGMKSLAARSPAVAFVQPALALADRGVLLDEAERFARDGVAATDAHFEAMRKRMRGRVDDVEKVISSQRGAFHEALGWVLFQRGRFPEAEEELRKAWKLSPASHTTAYRLGRLLESRRLFDEAEELYRTGMALPTPAKNGNGDALKALYEKRHGSLDGWEAYLATARNADAATRRQHILEERLRGRPVPAFTLKTLDGKTVSVADLKGKVAVVNFWGIWCGWCVEEMPDYQKLAEKYAGADDVVILTINNDQSVDKVKKWMAEQKYSFPVLLDDAFATKHVRVFPTTWFIDGSGELAFEKRGWTKQLVEEFSWRIESLR